MIKTKKFNKSNWKSFWPTDYFSKARLVEINA